MEKFSVYHAFNHNIIIAEVFFQYHNVNMRYEANTCESNYIKKLSKYMKNYNVYL